MNNELRTLINNLTQDIIDLYKNTDSDKNIHNVGINL